MGMQRVVVDQSYATGFGTSPANGTGKPFVPGPILEPDRYAVSDVTAAGPAIAGKLLVGVISAAQIKQAQWQLSAVLTQALQECNRGVVEAAGQAQTGGNLPLATVVVRGPVQAYVTTTANTNKAIAVGDPLCADGAGNLTSAPAAPTPGQIIATAGAAVAGGVAAATLIPVIMGNY